MILAGKEPVGTVVAMPDVEPTDLPVTETGDAAVTD